MNSKLSGPERAIFPVPAYPAGTTSAAIASLILSLCLSAQAALSAAAPPAGMILVKAKGLNFMMGMDPSEFQSGDPWAHYENRHKVSFTYDFYMDTTLVSQADYLDVMKANPASRKTGDLKLPVEMVSWYDAVLYMNVKSKRENLDTAYSYTSVTRSGSSVSNLPGLKFNLKSNGYRLPTNAEYEYAERAGTTGKYFWAPDGKNVDALGGAVAWWAGNSNNTTHPVGTKKPNPWGLYDLVGNLFEWCYDWNAAYPTGDDVDPIGAASSPENNKVAKGGSYRNDMAGHMRIQYHYKWAPRDTHIEVGFRAVRTVTGATGVRLGVTGAHALNPAPIQGLYPRLILSAGEGGALRLYDLGGRMQRFPDAARSSRIGTDGE